MTPHSTTPAPQAGPQPAVLVLEDGRIHRGTSFGATGTTLGEAVFTTGMSGYQETLTDPSYCRQIVVATAPQIGNTGWNDEDGESLLDGEARGGRIWVSGFVIRDLSRQPSNHRSSRSLEDEMAAQGVVGIAGIDTRAVVRHIRELGAMKAGIFSGDDLTDDETMLTAVRAQESMAGASLSDEVSTREAYVVEPEGEASYTIAALDLGIKTNTPRMLTERGVRVHVLPADSTLQDILDLGVDGVFLSNGPGDPATADHAVHLTKEVLGQGIPFFGICFGNQILGRALGLETYKMQFGHRGINIPVIEKATGAVAITSQNHGFALRAPEGDTWQTPWGTAAVTHVCANDGTVEGVALVDGSAFSVQYHPESAAGPRDAADLFDRFVSLLESSDLGSADSRKGSN
ncbi:MULTISPECIES: glutamine-hydrolyzing carbamoyl-phosphate synthase small subunit [Dietzia]|uniref:Carbamoyl phosphate synthase small chain n=1 Tax=Dietzia maris TaxID=37915 RepID=A0ABT8GWT1_9ACTN|nr:MULTISPECIES: glutamine-hydrolyzing carbamoyl-phosphate synthase small subunit [Dietzia]MBB0991251.1 glutamine-hydrolyzing carbamoyl-phosphate synthase small subunit [Dietzia sp. SLG510A3-30A2]MDJ0423115.1 glutamine-hydrolyzing carbamoyl-phosphate synthase small subunit [Dietzia kunjamensis]MDN4504672.1 glutamine-hydrolyzing carbamoyl-phosphate synthase small subunit [Dietzia maris]